MMVRYLNNQSKLDPMNGKAIADSATLVALLEERRKDRPFIANLFGENGFELVCGIGSDLCCVEHMRSTGDVPYLMAISADPPMKSGDAEFLTANTPTPIPARYILSFDELKQIALHFLETGERSGAVRWEEI
jgi:immunity protein Imm1 of predicted polymorphic toxin system